MRRTLLVSLVATVFVATNAVWAVAQTDATAEVVGIQLLPHPDQEGMGRRGMVSIVADARPGSVVEREIRVSNDTSERQAIDVYIGGASLEGSEFTPDDDPDHPIARWGTVSPGLVRLDPGQRSPGTVRIAVPEDAVEGEHYGVVWVQPPASDGPVRQVNRVGVRIYLTVVDGVAPVTDTTDFSINSMTAVLLPDGRRRVVADVRNTGERAVDLVGELQLTEGPSALSAGPFPTDAVTTLAIGASGVVSVTLDDGLPLGQWLARLELSSGAVTRTAEATIVFPDDPGEGDEAQSETIGGTDEDGNDISERLRGQRRALLPLAAVMVLLALGALWLMLMWKRRDEDEDDAEGGDGASAEAVVGAGGDDDH